MKELLRMDSLENLFAVQAIDPVTLYCIEFYKITASFQILDLPEARIFERLSSNSWVMAYDSLRQALLVSVLNRVSIYKVDFESYFGA